MFNIFTVNILFMNSYEYVIRSFSTPEEATKFINTACTDPPRVDVIASHTGSINGTMTGSYTAHGSNGSQTGEIRTFINYIVQCRTKKDEAFQSSVNS